MVLGGHLTLLHHLGAQLWADVQLVQRVGGLLEGQLAAGIATRASTAVVVVVVVAHHRGEVGGRGALGGVGHAQVA